INPSLDVYSAACARFVPLIETGILSGPETEQAIEEYVGPLLSQGIDTLVLGCTHYPFLAPVISQCAGQGVTLVDPACETVEELSEILRKGDLLNDHPGNKQRDFYVSGNDESFYIVGRMLLGDVIQKVHRVDLY
ncbi:MAG: glutamate racemase, partial [Syntrophomonadaceae bacterium]